MIPRGMRYYRRRLRPVCLLCHGEAERVQGPILRIVQTLDYKSRCQKHGDNENKKGSPSPTGFLCKGRVVNGEFIPDQVYLTTDSLEDQEAVETFLEEYGLKGDLNQT